MVTEPSIIANLAQVHGQRYLDFTVDDPLGSQHQIGCLYVTYRGIRSSLPTITATCCKIILSTPPQVLERTMYFSFTIIGTILTLGCAAPQTFNPTLGVVFVRSPEPLRAQGNVLACNPALEVA